MTQLADQLEPLDAYVVPDTPAGPLAVVVTPEDGVVRAAGFGPLDGLVARLPAALAARGVAEGPPRGAAAEAIERYLAGDLAALDGVAVEQRGSAFLDEAWRVMRQIPPGETWTYAELAAEAGRPGAARAAGQACARNLVAPFVPCHRVVSSGGRLSGGYAYGVEAKQRLLAHERGEAAPA